MTDFQTFRPGKAKHNAEAMLTLWNRTGVWVDEHNDGLFELSSSGDSGGITTFDELVDLIEQFDTLQVLSPADRRSAAAMVFHLAPTMTYDGDDSVATDFVEQPIAE